MSFYVELITPYHPSEIIEGVKSADFTTVKGRIQVLSGHAPLAGELTPCKITLKKEDGHISIYDTDGGAVRVTPQSVSLISSRITREE